MAASISQALHNTVRRITARTLIGLLTVTLIGPDTLTQFAPVAHASEGGVVLNEIHPGNQSYVELYNTSSTTVDLSGWQIRSNDGTELLSGTIAAGSIQAFDLETDLDRSDDRILLTNGSQTLVDQLTYGDSAGATLPGVDLNRSLLRTPNGASAWVSNAPASEDDDNDSGLSVATPTSITLPATSENPAQTINDTNDTNAVIHVGGTTAAEVTLALTDSEGTTKLETNDADAALTPFEISTSSLSEGALMARAYNESVDELRSRWFEGAAIQKDTVEPEHPVVTQPQTEITVHGSSYAILGTAEIGATVQLLQDDVVLAHAIANPNFSLAAPLLADQANDFDIRVIDPAGNVSSTRSIPTITEDSSAPSAPTDFVAEAREDGRIDLTWDLPPVEVVQVALYGDNGSGTINFDAPLAVLDDSVNEYTTPLLSKGTYRFALRALDEAGNWSAPALSLPVTLLNPTTTVSLDGGAQTIDWREEQGILLNTGSQTVAGGTLSLTNFVQENPRGVTPTGRVIVGNFYRVLSTNQTIFPLTIHILYTAEHLAQASVTNERQLHSVMYFDESAGQWVSFEGSVLDTTDRTIDGVAYAGSMTVITSHLTDIALAADIAAPQAPTHFAAEAGDSRVKLTWKSVDDSIGYIVRYRVKSTGSYASTFVSGSQQTALLIQQLSNGTAYEFGIASEDAVGNRSEFITIEQTPSAPQAVVPATSQSTRVMSPTTPTNNDGISQTQPTPTQEPSVTPSPDPSSGDIRGGETEKDQTDNARSLVTFLIILIAAAAGFGGWYGYQWWVSRPEPANEPPAIEEDKKKTPPPPKRERTGRW